MIRFCHLAVRYLLFVGTCITLASPRASADVDVTGKWVISLSGFGPLSFDFVQVGTAITAATYSGTIDSMTGVFSMTQPTTPCGIFDPGWCELDGTVAPDSNSMGGTFACYFFKLTPPTGCFGYVDSFTGEREHCGDFYLNSGTEQCDNGVDNDDCCDSSCQLLPNGTACSDDNVFTNNDMCSAGTCVGSTSGMDFQINTYTTGNQIQASVACESGGGFVVAWLGVGATDSYGIFGRRYDSAGAALGTEFAVTAYTTNAQRQPAVASAPNGDFTVVWTDGQYPQTGRDGSLYAIYAQRFDSSGALLGGDFQVNTYTTSTQEAPDIASLGAAGTVMVWSSYGQDGDGFGVFGQRYDSIGGTLGSEFQVNSYTTSAQQFPSVASDGAGSFIVVWMSGGIVTPGGVMGRRYDASGTPVGSEITVSAFTPASAFQPDVAVDPAGNFVVAWYRDAGIFARRYLSSGAPAGSEFQVNTYTACFNFSPSATVDASGKFVIAWENGCQDGNASGTFAKRYNGNGTQQGPEFLVNPYTTGTQDDPSLCSTADGGFVATWASGGQDGDGGGIFGRRFPAPLVAPLDHYKCYQGTDLKTPPFAAIDVVATSDQIDSGPVAVQKLKFVCAPVDTNGEGINDPATHLACYQITGAKLVPRPHAQLSTQFQTSQFELKKPKLLCVPATKVLLP